MSHALLRSLVMTDWFCVSGCRLEQSEILEENQRNLLQITNRFFLAIINSSTEFPPQLRSVCHCLFQVHIRLHTSIANSNPLHNL